MKSLLLALSIAVAVPAQGQTRRQVPDSADYVPVLSAALGYVRDEFAFGRVVVDRAVIDTSKRLAPPLLSHREHRDTELWAKANRAEAVNPEAARPTCTSATTDCPPNEVSGAIGLSDPVIQGDSAKVWVRYTRYDGTAVAHLRTTVEVLTLRKTGNDWKVQGRKLKAVG